MNLAEWLADAARAVTAWLNSDRRELPGESRLWLIYITALVAFVLVVDRCRS